MTNELTPLPSLASRKRARVGVVSDTHGWVDPFLATAFAGCDLIVHGGDIGPGPVLEALDAIAPVLAIRGNIDGGPLRYLPLEAYTDVAGSRIGVRHICGNPFRPKPVAVRFIERDRLDVLVCGHSHIPVVQRVAGALWINPGAAGKQGFHKERYAAVLHLSAGAEPRMDRVNLRPRWPKPA